MICVNCGVNIIGNIPIHLSEVNRCLKCYNEYIASGSVTIHRAEDETMEMTGEKKLPATEIRTIEEVASDEKINNRWDILDI